MIAARLKTEYLVEPLGIDARKPILTWNCEGGKAQTAYEIVTEKWSSGRVESSSMRAVYPVAPGDRERVVWKIRLWDENGVVGEWSTTSFETGISQWTAKWITGDYKAKKSERYPVDCFRKCFYAENVVSARLYITACGLYEARLNGERIGNFLLAPGITDYRKRVQYQTYDVTALLKNGANELTVQLADGWYRGSVGAWGLRNQYGSETKLLAQLELTMADGSRTVIPTDGTWDWSNDGPIRLADNKDGETVDADLTPSYCGKAKLTRHSVTPTASNNVFVTGHERFFAKKIVTPSGKTVLDFGQNFAGIISFSVTAHRGDRIRLRFGEMLDSDGEFTQKNIQLSTKHKTTPLQQVDYTCREGRNDYKTAFSVFGFRYALVESDIPINAEDFTAIAVYSDMEETSEFSSSNELLNRFYRAAVWSAKSNHADLPTDCPTRERHGWGGDAQIFCGTASYLFNYRSFAEKYVRDLIDGQHRNGNIPQIAPSGGVDFYMRPMDGSAGWSDAVVLIPWRIYAQYGDTDILRKFYPAMKRYADYKISTVGKWYPTAKPTGVGLRYAKNICNYGQSYGEWAEPAEVKAFSIKDFISPHPEETTAYIAYLAEHMQRIAESLGFFEDASVYANTAEKVREGYRKLVSVKKFSLDVDRQAKQVRPLYMRLLDEKQTELAKKRLIRSLDNYGWRLGTGFLSTPFILYVLTDIDPEYAYRLLENENIPGWLSMPKNGANTVWEAWEGPNSTQGGIGSLNHYSKGAVLEWVFSVMCGISVAGENHFRIAPVPGGHFTHASLSYKSVYGKVSSAWKKMDDRVEYTVSVPANCTAELVINGESRHLGAGEYKVTI